MIREGMFLLTLAVLPAACGPSKASTANRVTPASADQSSPREAVRDTGATPDTSRSDTGQAKPSAAGNAQDTSGASSVGGRGMMGRGMMGGRMGMMGGRGGQAPAASAQESADTGTCPQITQTLVDEGRQIFVGRGNCATCHGTNGQGGPLAPNLTDSTWLDTDGSYAGIARVVKTGVPQPKEHPAPMPPMGGASLSADQVCAVAGYVYSLSHKH